MQKVGMLDETFSQSKIKTYRRCPKAYDYKYNQGLTRRASPATLARGIVIHDMLDARVMGKDPMERLEEYRKSYDLLWEDEAESYSTPDDILSLYTRYCKFWAGENLDYQGLSEIEVRAEYQGMMFKGIIDKLPKDPQGRVWVSDHKTHKIIPDEATRFSDIQTVLYFWARREEGHRVDGILWDYIRTKPPTVPALLKAGGLTRRKDTDCDYDTWMKAILDNKLDPKDYQVELERSKSKVFFQRMYLPKPGEDLIKEVVKDFFDTAREIKNAESFPRNMTRDCKSCFSYPICALEVRGMDSDLVRKQMFVCKIPTVV